MQGPGTKLSHLSIVKGSVADKMEVWKLRGKDLKLTKSPLIMGILNVTPDSFSDGGKFDSYDKAMKHAEEMIRQGAVIIDIGGESTRPGAAKVGEAEELERVVPIVEGIVKNFDTVISVDTYKSKVAEETLKAGAHIINDIYGFLKDENMAAVAKQYEAGIVLMANAELRTDGSDIITYAEAHLKRSLELCHNVGITDDHILIDPGVGFHTTREEDLKLIRDFNYGDNTLLGVSRKRIVAHLLDRETEASERAAGSVGLALAGAAKGARVIRVHDVLETRDALKTYAAVMFGEDS